MAAFVSSESCMETVDGEALRKEWCKSNLLDGICWPATPPGTSRKLLCQENNITNEIIRQCSAEGAWTLINSSSINLTACKVSEERDNLSLAIELRVRSCGNDSTAVIFVGFGLSVLCLLVSMGLFSCFKKLRTFRNLLWYQIILAALLYGSAKLCVLFISEFSVAYFGKSWCPVIHFFMEYCKCVLIFWIFIEMCFLHNAAVCPVYPGKASLLLWLFIGYIVPLVQTTVWFTTYVGTVRPAQSMCLECYIQNKLYYMHSVPMIIEMTISLLLVLNTGRALWCNIHRDKKTVWLFRETNLQSFAVVVWSFGLVMDPFVARKSVTSFMAAYEGLVIVTVFLAANKAALLSKQNNTTATNSSIQDFQLVDSRYL